MKPSSFGNTDRRSFFSLGVATYLTKTYIAITFFIGPFTRTFELYLGQ